MPLFVRDFTGPPTRKLYHDDTTAYRATAHVVALQDDLVVLDSTLFYAESGGQVSDTGLMDGVPVSNVLKTGGKPVKVVRDGLEPIWVATGTHIIHQVADSSGLRVGQEVCLQIDEERRREITRNHTGAHFLFEALRRVLRDSGGGNVNTRGCAIDENGFRFDISNRLPPELTREVERVANQLIAEGHRIAMRPDPACDDVFHWECGSISIPCGGTHLTTSEGLGPLSVQRRSKGRLVMRVSALFGKADETL